jgi:hypothetical protein
MNSTKSKSIITHRMCEKLTIDKLGSQYQFMTL